MGKPPGDDGKQGARRARVRTNPPQSEFANILGGDQPIASLREREGASAKAGLKSWLYKFWNSNRQTNGNSGRYGELELGGQWPWLLLFFRAYRNLSQEDLAEMIGSSADSISRWEQGLCEPDLNTQYKLRDFILSPLDSDNMFQDAKGRIEASSGLYNANWGKLVVASSQGLLRNCAMRGYTSPQLERADLVHNRKFERRISKQIEAGYFKGEVLMSYGFVRVNDNDTRLLITQPLKLETGAILSLVMHQHWEFPPELEGRIQFIRSDTVIG